MRLNKLIMSGAAGDKEALEELFYANKGLIYLVVNRFKHNNEDAEDLFQIASIGFIKALKRYDPNLGHQFSTYAVPVMMGEIKRYLRDNGPVKVSRIYKETALKAEKLRMEMLQKNQNEPTLKELANAMSIAPEELATALSATKPPESLDKLCSNENFSLLDTLSEDKTYSITDKIALGELIQNLPDREQKIITLRYVKEFSQSKIAKSLGISQVQVSRIEKKILEKLRTQMQAK